MLLKRSISHSLTHQPQTSHIVPLKSEANTHVTNTHMQRDALVQRTKPKGMSSAKNWAGFIYAERNCTSPPPKFKVYFWQPTTAWIYIHHIILCSWHDHSQHQLTKWTRTRLQLTKKRSKNNLNQKETSDFIFLLSWLLSFALSSYLYHHPFLY